MIMELWQYSGEPTAEEIAQRLEFWKRWSPGAYKDDHLRIHPKCPNCNSNKDTEWVRNEWSICYNCLIAFTFEDTIPYYIIQDYEQDERIAEELLEYEEDYNGLDI